jgi:glycosyltransferase involved in cell wall biosynthesis
MYEWVDLASVAAAARALPGWDFVLVGPVRNPKALGVFEGLDNVRILPAQPASTVKRWLAGFDVGLIPFHVGEITDLADPIKLYEYYAMGLPVVSTVAWPLPPDAPEVYLAAADNSLAGAITAAREQDSTVRRQARVQFAKANTWSRRAEQLLELICQAG